MEYLENDGSGYQEIYFELDKMMDMIYDYEDEKNSRTMSNADCIEFLNLYKN